MTNQLETPRFLFERRPDVETAHDWLLAGILTIDVPREPMPLAKRYRHAVNDIIEALIVAAQTDAMPADGLTIGWQGDERDIEDDALEEWRKRSLTFMVRAYMRDGDQVRVEVRVAEDERPTLH
jgi:hypothetical protein